MAGSTKQRSAAKSPRREARPEPAGVACLEERTRVELFELARRLDVAGEPGRFAVRDLLLRFGQGQTDRAQPLEQFGAASVADGAHRQASARSVGCVATPAARWRRFTNQ